MKIRSELAPSDGWNIMKKGIPHDYVNKKITCNHTARERINIRHHQKPALDYRFPSWTSGPLPIPRIPTLPRHGPGESESSVGLKIHTTMVNLRTKRMRHSAISSLVIRFQKLKGAIYHKDIPSRNSPNKTLSKRSG